MGIVKKVDDSRTVTSAYQHFLIVDEIALYGVALVEATPLVNSHLLYIGRFQQGETDGSSQLLRGANGSKGDGKFQLVLGYSLLRDAQHYIVEVEVTRVRIVLFKHVSKGLSHRAAYHQFVADHARTTNHHIALVLNGNHVVFPLIGDGSGPEFCLCGRHREGGTHRVAVCTKSIGQNFHTLFLKRVAVEHLYIGDVWVVNLRLDTYGTLLQQVPGVLLVNGVNQIVLLHNFAELLEVKFSARLHHCHLQYDGK